MHKFKFFFLFSFLFFAGGIQAQNSKGYTFEKNNALKINPFAFGQAEFRIAYEHFFKNRQSSISLIPSYTLREAATEDVKGWQIMSQYKFYLTHLNKDERKNFLSVYNYGFYCGVYGLFNHLTSDYERTYWIPDSGDSVTDRYQMEVDAFEGGALVGLQTDITKRIVFDFYVGGGLRDGKMIDTFDAVESHDYYNDQSVFNPTYKGVRPRIGFQLGVTL